MKHLISRRNFLKAAGVTTAAAAIATALYGGVGWAGRGTGVDDEGLRRQAWRALAELAEQRGDAEAAAEAWKRAALGE